MKKALFVAITSISISIGLWAGAEVFGKSGDTFAMFRYCLRMLTVVPLVTMLAIIATHAFNEFTPGEWMPDEWNDEIPKAIVLSSLIYCIFWLGVQG
jgi:ABC-type uncharacterized transport system YnjBCD permease subunit